jgi:hypothetical protein
MSVPPWKYKLLPQQRPKTAELPRSAALDMLAAEQFADKEFGSSGLFLTPTPPTGAPLFQPPMIPPPPWSENYIPENDQPEPEAEAIETEPPPRPAIPPPPWAKPEGDEA